MRNTEKIKSIIAQMTLREKICQMLIVTPEQLLEDVNRDDVSDVYTDGLKINPVGGLIFFEYHLQNPEHIKKVLSSYQEASLKLTKLPIFLCVDEEGGGTARLANCKTFDVPNVGPMQNITTTEDAYTAGATIGKYLTEYGFNVDFAPDADVITNPLNQIIGDRSFGTDANVVTELAVAYSDGLHSQNILSTFKHFPGHGATEGDTHEGYAFTNKSYEELRKDELVPFEAAEENNVDFIMMAHISVPNILGDNTPCTLSHEMVTDVLRRDMGYKHLIITDALNMGAVSQNYSIEDACVKAVAAGNDILLMPMNINKACNAIEEAIKDKIISETQIDESVVRIIEAKLRL